MTDPGDLDGDGVAVTPVKILPTGKARFLPFLEVFFCKARSAQLLVEVSRIFKGGESSRY